MTTVSMDLNGVPVRKDVPAREHLADFLRESCNQTGVHLGCEQGACGACTVTVDGVPVRSCLVLTVMCDGRKVETIEGTRSDPTMNVIRRHFHEEHALQCGFCTPGMLMTARDIIARHPRPDEARIRSELSGQICRCTGYMGIVAAIKAAAAELSGASAASTEPQQT